MTNIFKLEFKNLKIIICLTLLAPFAHAGEKSKLAKQNAAQSLSVVQVLSTLWGSGTLILIDGQPKILTNSHVIQGKISQKIIFPAVSIERSNKFCQTSVPSQKALEFDASTEWELPVADIAVLSLPSSVSSDTLSLLKCLGQSNVDFISHAPGFHYAYPEVDDRDNAEQAGNYSDLIGLSAKKKVQIRSELVNELISLNSDRNGNNFKYQFADPKYGQWTENLNSVLEGVPTSTRSITPWKSVMAPDEYLSGFFKRAIVIPIFARPGMSGGAFYHRGRFIGLLAKLELDATVSAYAIPVDEIAKLIQWHYFKGANPYLPEASWISNNQENIFQVKFSDGDLLQVSNKAGKQSIAGGAVGNGGSGGAVGNGGKGGAVGNGGDDSSSAWWYLTITGLWESEQMITSSPFSHATGNISLNGKNIAYLKTENHWLAPSVAEYTYLKSKGKVVTAIEKNFAVGAELMKARAEWPKTFHYARIYHQRAPSHYLIGSGYKDITNLLNNHEERIMDSTGFGDSAQAFFKENARPNYLWNFPFKPSDLLKQGGLDIYEYSGQDRYNNHFIIQKDLQEISVALNNSTHHMVLVTPEDSLTLIYAEKDTGYEAALIYQDDEIRNLDRAYIKTPNKIYEFIACIIGKECIR